MLTKIEVDCWGEQRPNGFYVCVSCGPFPTLEKAAAIGARVRAPINDAIKAEVPEAVREN